jgi:thioester reductase-like protein/non-ribosomal peptide synthase protein (TIGR01720 family)
MVDHPAVVRLVKDTNYMAFNQGESILQTGALEFDASTFEIWGCLLNGLTLYLVSKDTILNGEKFKKSIRENNITTLFITSALFNQMLDMDIDIFNGLKYLLTGGDIVSAAHVNRLRQHVPGITVFNMYGPTENTTFSTFNPVEKDYKENIPIGKPIADSTVYILDRGHNPVPVGVPGELYVGGCGVARGYLNNPDMTHRKFFPDPFFKGTANCPSMYATGDLARWLPTGKIEFLGRFDFQVKIRGFRIEPGEIDNRLMRLDFIEDACVVARKEPGSAHHYLCAYFSSSRKVDIAELKKRLLKDLPSYMIPAYFIQMDALPLNNNGKVDRRALPDPEVEIETGDYKAPGTQNEKLLAEIWQEVLGIEKIGIHDDFFAIGGDSIKTVLISGRLQKRGLSVSVNDFFRNPTIKELAGYVKKVEHKIHQAPVTGNVELTPIQKWYFEKDFKEKHHFNHVVTQFSSKGFNEDIIKKVFTKIVEHHDALRMVYEIDEDKVTQRNRGLNEGELFSLEVIDFGDKKEFEKELTEEAGRINKGIDLKTGPLVKLGLSRTVRGDYLMIAVHHAVVDGISWRILLQDLETACEQAEKGEEIKFQDKTDSFQYWASKLKEYANTPEQLNQLDYWKEIDALSGDHKPKKKKLKDSDVVSMNLNKEDTGKLIKEVNGVYNTEINDILLTALGMAVKEWKGNQKVLIGLEGHGREGIIEGIDISRTVGWFTSQYPVLLDMKPSAGDKIEDHIQQVKETLRRIPAKGIGYGILKYLTSPGKKGDVAFTLQPGISFNYLGQLDDAAVESGKRFQLKIENSMSPEFDTGYAIDIYGGAGRDGLSLTFDYNRQEYDRAGIEKLADCFKSNLLKIIGHCMEEKEEMIRGGISAMDYHIEKDTERYMRQVKQEEWPDLTEKNNYEHILLTGAAGFMGAHMVPELLDNTNAVLYLPVRGETREKAEERLKKRWSFYFGNDFFDAHKDRIVIIKADLGHRQLGVDKEQYDKLCKTVDAVVHPAANVKHHGLYEDLYRDNVVATENLLELALTGKKKDFHYVSTLDTGRGDIPGREYNFFTEYCHDVGQETDHIYIKSKLEAEKRVLAYREKGLNGSIYRVGNLVFQSDTGIFQENIGDDYFYSIIKGVVRLEMMTDNMKKIIFDMSFIDWVAKAAVLLLTRSRLKNETYHICNPNKLPMTEMAMFLEELGCELKQVKQENAADYFARFEGNSEYEKIIELFKLHSWIFEEKTGTLPVYKIDRTVTLLEKLGFEWPKITRQHIEKMIAHCKQIGFL